MHHRTDADRLGKLLSDCGALIPLVVAGVRLGLYQALADSGPMTASELAARTDTEAGYVAGWLAGVASWDCVTCARGKYSLSPAQARLFAGDAARPTRTTPSRVEIRVLGELAVLRDGVPQPLPRSRKTRALLGYLVVTGRPQLRERLCQLLWDGPDDPRAALRWSLHKLRPATGGLVADREHVALAAGAETDLGRVRAAVGARPAEATTQALRAAASGFDGELLEGIELADCFRFHEWLAAEREAARRLRLAIVTELAERQMSDPKESLRWAHERLILEPLEEAAHLQVARALGALGRVREALAQLQACRAAVTSELQSVPSAEVERARRALLARDGARLAPIPRRIAG